MDNVNQSLIYYIALKDAGVPVKMHTMLGLHGNIPTFIRITDGTVHDVNMLVQILPEAGAFYVMDGRFIDFKRLKLTCSRSAAFFVVRTKNNVLLQRRYSRTVDKSTGVRSDQTVIQPHLRSSAVLKPFMTPSSKRFSRSAFGPTAQEIEKLLALAHARPVSL